MVECYFQLLNSKSISIYVALQAVIQFVAKIIWNSGLDELKLPLLQLDRFAGQ